MEHIWLNQYDNGVCAAIGSGVLSLTDILEKTCRSYGEKPALKEADRIITYKELNSLTSLISGNLRLFGLNRQEKVCVLMPNSIETIMSFWAIVRGGAIGVMTNPLYSEVELLHQIEDSDSRFLITSEVLLPKVLAVIDKSHLELVFVLAADESTLNGTHKKVYGFSELLKPNRGYSCSDINPLNDLAVLQYTGGTTGVSKGCMLTHANLTANAEQCRNMFSAVLNEGEEKFIGVLPFFHIYSLQLSVIYPARIGAQVLPIMRFNPRTLLSLAEKEKATAMASAPSIFGACLSQKDITSYNLSSFKLVISGSAPLPVSQMELFEKMTGAKISEGYGLSETSPVTHCSPVAPKIRRPGSIGIPLPSTDAKIVDVEHGIKELGVSEIGELCVKGPQVMQGYYKQPDETNAVLKDGWLRTGDIAYYDKDGYFYITARKKDLIISGGYNVYPRDVEEVLLKYPKVHEAVVVGIPDTFRGEVVKAFVVPSEGESISKNEIVAHCRKYLANYKVPREIVFRDSLPKSAVGKVLRRKLVDENQ